MSISSFFNSKQAHLIDAPDDGPHGGVPRAVDRAAVVRGAPGGGVDVDQVRLVAHGVGLDQVGHVGLVKHADAYKHVDNNEWVISSYYC